MHVQCRTSVNPVATTQEGQSAARLASEYVLGNMRGGLVHRNTVANHVSLSIISPQCEGNRFFMIFGALRATYALPLSQHALADILLLHRLSR